MSRSARLRTSAAVTAALALAATSLASATTAEAKPRDHRPPRPCPTLKVSEGWYGDNKARIDALVADHCRDKDSRAGKPVAVFDWDNTVIKNDVGDATFYWLLRNNRVRPPKDGDWSTTSRHLTPEAATALGEACPAGGRTLPTATDTRCADELLSVYGSGATTGGKTAFAGHDRRRTEPQYAWLAQLLRGWTTHQVESFAAAARAENLAAPQGATQRVGTARVTGWVRYYTQQRDLIRTLQDAGFDVWIVSASPEPVVDVWAKGVGVAPSHTLGIRNTTDHGRLTAHLKGCGSVRDGEDTTITYIDGKRCWINQEIFGVRGPPPNASSPPPGDRCSPRATPTPTSPSCGTPQACAWPSTATRTNSCAGRTRTATAAGSSTPCSSSRSSGRPRRTPAPRPATRRATARRSRSADPTEA